ncbi:SRPBCC family protein [Paenarthrobacter nitroguajacolicus]|uniref:SRPBCC family protein n=1 Tax=Paenarthrobacter nitroguajacolicus TaxID=211146 RepID=UPI00285CAAD7|nr:SRPBCC family protein [Paenarthrobacter nitroguajacolicus]MDR6638833.1 putative membrane protein [Paenarthrobacter nitroguajacolicus]
MAFADHEVVIHRDAMTIYAFLMDGMNNSLWRSGIRSISLRSGNRGQKGALYQQTIIGPGGRPVAADFQITEARPGAEVRFAVVAGPARPTGGYYLSTEGQSTRLRFALEYHPKGLQKLMNPMIQKSMEQEVAQLEQLKSVMESRSVA